MCFASLALLATAGHAQQSAVKPGSILKDCPVCPELVVLPKGSFLMGSPTTDIDSPFRERPQHRVDIGVTLAMGRHEVTRGEFEAFVRDRKWVSPPFERCEVWSPFEPSYRPFRDDNDGKRSFADPGFDQADDHPVTCLSWEDARTYLAWLNEKTGGGLAYRLPTEAEWEYAARAGRDNARYHWGEDMDASAQCQWANGGDRSFQRQLRRPGGWEVAACDDRHAFTAPARAFKPNAFGLYNMHGNVWEWVQDVWHDDYDGAPVDGSAWQPKDDAGRKELRQRDVPAGGVLRGGSWSSPPENLRSASRSYHLWTGRLSSVGFRVVRVVRE